MSEDRDFFKIEEGLKLLNISFGRIASKAQHLNESMQYLIDELALFKNNLQIMEETLNGLKKPGDESK